MVGDIRAALARGSAELDELRIPSTSRGFAVDLAAGIGLHSLPRFIPVRSDEDRILTCFLEYGEDFVTVHDLLHQRHGGQRQQRVSSYRKLRLSPPSIAATLTEHGLTVRQESGPSGMTQIVGTRQSP